MKDITVMDNFFKEKEFNILNSNLNKISWQIQKDKNGEKYGFSHVFDQNEQNKWLFDKIKKSFFNEKNLIAIDASYRIRHNFHKVLPHNDNFANYSFICYLKGKQLMYNGTGFYNDNKDLDRYIGFKENRAIFFDSKIFHTDLQALGESSPRYSLNIFYRDDQII